MKGELLVLGRADTVIIDGEVVHMVSWATRLRERHRELEDPRPFIYRK